MKIVITSDIYFPMINGVAIFAHNLANGLAKKGHEVLVICPSFNGKKHHSIDPETGVQTWHLSSLRFPFYPDQINKVPDGLKLLGLKLPRLIYKNGIWVSPHPYPEMRKILRRFKPDVIHNQTAETIAIATIWYARRYKIPLVSTGHAYPDNITSQVRLLRPIKRPLDAILRTYMTSFLKNSEYATMPTEIAIDDLVPKNRQKFKVEVEAISNGVDLARFKPGPKPNITFYQKYGINPKHKIVLHIGRIDPEKSIEKVILAFKQIAKDIKNSSLVIVGDGIQKPKLEDLAKSVKLSDRIIFTGKILGEDLIQFYRLGDVFVTASETETQGLVLIESAAMKLPLIAVDAGAVKEVCVNNVNGILCQPKNITEIANAIKTILSDSKLRRKMSEESYKIAQKHDLNKTLARFEEVYKIAINLKKI